MPKIGRGASWGHSGKESVAIPADMGLLLIWKVSHAQSNEAHVPQLLRLTLEPVTIGAVLSFLEPELLQ